MVVVVVVVYIYAHSLSKIVTVVSGTATVIPSGPLPCTTSSSVKSSAPSKMASSEIITLIVWRVVLMAMAV